ncbi:MULTISPECIES: serine/threonine-protein kinase [unclassified Wenzhouxiangella]|uniref:serine/threonine-protein kinase n=1 Tax=unclassified Wenzhouxiangella TaxID=2613841 RepID=UPI000E32B2BC|nr:MULTISPECIES: serine/threonine-protein kinase [unclassified Wenzhouxiangella]RFF27564.1 serine/threonine protein kinase [Wenzhouxiangella sp. 15181]RFP69574.1 serine/threonine protein kinase [Wenzhouxiangella sp. 15190]
MTSIERLRELDRWLERKLAGEPDSIDEDEEASDEQARRLLAHAGQPLEALTRSPAGEPEFGARLAAALAESGQAGPGEVIGPFRIEQAIGSGGMGVVYRARRVSGGFEQTVALKVLGGARPDEAAVGRFERERDLLSRLEHPGIARLIDGGLTADGRPWFAMEHIEGQPIDDYCSRYRLGIRARVSLIRQVCEALDYAHGQMVLHRDIKPANILVDDYGRVRLVDFGLGGIQADLASGVQEATQLSRRWLTPEYASPEQLNGKAIDVRSEVYQLGLVLYRLLCAESPYETTGESPAEWIEAVTHAQPTAPSERWLDKGQLAREFGSTRQALRRRLRGDLDQIVLMALRKEPERRYASVRVFGNDLDNFLEGRPVKARPDGVRYRLVKYAIRHPWGLAASALGLVIAVSAVVLHIDRLQAERDRAQLEASKATMISDFLVGLFESADPVYEAGPELPVRELLARGGRELDALDARPAIQAQMAGVLARVYRALGEYDRSLDLAERTVELLHQAHGERDLRVAQGYNNLGQTLHHMDRPEEAVAAHTQALAIVRAQSPVPEDELANTYHRLGNARRNSGNFAEARNALRQALSIRREMDGEQSQPVSHILSDLAMTNYRIGDFDRSLSQLQRASQQFASQLGPDHPVSIKTDTRLAAVKNHLGDHEGAADILSRLLVATRRIYDDRHPAVATAWFELGYAQYKAGDHAGAGRAWNESLDIRREVYGSDHPEVAGALQALAAVAREAGDLQRAENLLKQVQAINETHRGPRSSAVAANLNNLGTIRADLGQHKSALDHYRQSLDIYSEIYGENHAKVASVLHRMGEVNLKLEREEHARRQISRALAIRADVLPAEHPDLLSTQELAARLESVAATN